jgi:hypothetical protein
VAGGRYHCADHAPKDGRAELEAELETAEEKLAALNAKKFNRYEARDLDPGVAKESSHKLATATRLIQEVRDALGK